MRAQRAPLVRGCQYFRHACKKAYRTFLKCSLAMYHISLLHFSTRELRLLCCSLTEKMRQGEKYPFNGESSHVSERIIDFSIPPHAEIYIGDKTTVACH